MASVVLQCLVIYILIFCFHLVFLQDSHRFGNNIRQAMLDTLNLFELDKNNLK